MKTLIVYYSLEGNTKEAAEKIAQALSCDTMQLLPVKDIPKKGLLKFLHGGSGATKGKGTDLQPYTANVRNYDAIIIGTPVWAGKPSMAVNQFMADLGPSDSVMGAFAFAGGSSEKCLQILKEKYPSIKCTVGLNDRNSKKLAAANESKIESFIHSLQEILG